MRTGCETRESKGRNWPVQARTGSSPPSLALSCFSHSSMSSAIVTTGVGESAHTAALVSQRRAGSGQPATGTGDAVVTVESQLRLRGHREPVALYARHRGMRGCQLGPQGSLATPDGALHPQTTARSSVETPYSRAAITRQLTVRLPSPVARSQSAPLARPASPQPLNPLDETYCARAS